MDENCKKCLSECVDNVEKEVEEGNQYDKNVEVYQPLYDTKYNHFAVPNKPEKKVFAQEKELRDFLIKSRNTYERTGFADPTGRYGNGDRSICPFPAKAMKVEETIMFKSMDDHIKPNNACF